MEGKKGRASPGSELFEGLLSVLGSSGSRDAERASGNGRANSERCGTDGGGADHGGAAGGGAEEGGRLHDVKERKLGEKRKRRAF